MPQQMLQHNDVQRVLSDTLNGIDQDTSDYFCGMIMDTDGVNEEELQETLAPFLESYGLADTEEDAKEKCSILCAALRLLGMHGVTVVAEVKQLDKASKMNRLVS